MESGGEGDDEREREKDGQSDELQQLSVLAYHLNYSTLCLSVTVHVCVHVCVCVCVCA